MDKLKCMVRQETKPGGNDARPGQEEPGGIPFLVGQLDLQWPE